MRHPLTRHEFGAVPPFGCRWCGDPQGSHGLQWVPSRRLHSWERPTDRQIYARMLARRIVRRLARRGPS